MCGSLKSLRFWPLATLSTGSGEQEGLWESFTEATQDSTSLPLCIMDSTSKHPVLTHKPLIFANVELLVRLTHFLKDYSFVEMKLLSMGKPQGETKEGLTYNLASQEGQACERQTA